MKIKKLFCFSFLMILLSLLVFPFLHNPEAPILIKIFDLSFQIVKAYTGLCTDDFSRAKYNQIINLQSFFTFYSSETHIEKLKVPSLFDDYQIDVNLYINKTFMKENANLPTIVYIHGGGHVVEYADLQFIEKFTETGHVFIEIKYRLAPEYKFPIPLNDCFSVLHSESIFKYSDKSRLALFGDSSGGNQVISLILMMKDRKSEVLNRIQFLFIFYPSTLMFEGLPSHEKYENWYILTKEMMKYFISTYASKESDYENPYFNIMKGNFSELPEIYLGLSERDFLFSEGQLLANILRNAGNSVTVKTYPIEHGFLTFPIKEVDEAMTDIIKFLKHKKF